MRIPYISITSNCPLESCSKADILEVQTALEWAIYNPGPLDGLYGKKTATAWDEYKTDRMLGNPGWIGPESSSMLNGQIAEINTALQIPYAKDGIDKLAPLMRMPYSSQVAYIDATVQWETAGTWQPVKEAYWVNNAEEWRKNNLRYYPWYGRGLVQLTWENNYRKYADILGMPLVDQPDLACEMDVALFVLCHGFATGLFTGRKISDYIYTDEPKDFVNARRCINGTDKAQEIANIAMEYYNAN